MSDASTTSGSRSPEENRLRKVSFERLIRWCLVVVTLALFARVLGHDFVKYDDPSYVTENPWVRQGFTRGSLVWAFTGVHSSNWHPLTTLSHILDWKLFGPMAAGHHFVNVVLHTANSLLLFGFLRRVTGAVWQSAFVAALFTLHPLHVESVAWVSERKDVLSGLFFFLTLRAYADYVERPGRGRYVIVVLWLVLGLMSKPMLVTLPLVLLLLDWWPLKRTDTVPLGRLFIEKVPLLVLVTISCVVTFVAQRHGGAVVPPDVVPAGFRISNSAVSYVAYLGKMVWPVNLVVYYPLRGFVPWWQTAASIGFLLAVTACLCVVAKRHPYGIMGWLWYLGMLVPVIGIVLVGQASMADRYTYLPMIGVWIALTWGITAFVAKRPGARRAIAWAAGIVLIACGVATWFQSGYWRDSIALWGHARQVTGFNFLANCNYGNALAEAGRLGEAAAAYRDALRLMPHDADTHYKLAVTLDDLGRRAEAKTQYVEVLRLNPNQGEAHNNLGLLLAAEQSWTNAITHYREAIRLLPSEAGPHNNLGNALAAQSQWDAAITEYETAIRLRPGYEKAQRNLAAALAAKAGTNTVTGASQP